MKIFFATAFAALFLFSTQTQAADGMEVLESDSDMAGTIDRLLSALDDAGMNIFQEVDHSMGAAGAGMELEPTYLVMFGNPEIGTQLMQCGRSVGIDLPMKALIWQEDETVYVGYNSADHLAERHGLEDCDEVIGQVSGALENFASQAAGQ
ncbi:MAG: DUF302 domain-containing protein [Ectothiorhodospiraceae bacterium]|nr:DUF302 domain-containing protein [Ectothiorhodospiraceae bacterium]MCH8506228.1 DUF302 domain-containing protein [Ectothiorhodospiraceae bacterium]